MKVALVTLCLVLVAVHQSDAQRVTCVQGDGTDTTPKDCAEGFSKCYQPKFVEYTGMSAGMEYGCGECETKDVAICEDCAGQTNDACNIPKETGVEFKCHDYELLEDATKFTPKKESTTCQRLKATAIMCNMPGNFDRAYKLKNNGCGPCNVAAKDVNACVECEGAECNKPPAPPAIMCIQGSDGTAAPTVCATESGKAAAAKCHQPKFIEYTGLATGQTYGCGACDTNNANCQDCDGNSKTACQKTAETAADFKCYDYEVKDDKQVMKETAVTCKRLKDTAIKCHMPGESADKTFKVHQSGCGPCTAEDLKAKKCAECTTAECNKMSSASTLTAFLVPLLATLYTLL